MKHAEQTIADLEARLQELDAEAQRIKTAINCLCEVMGQQPKYEEISPKPAHNVKPRSDQYYGRALATIVTEALEKRRNLDLGSAALDEIYDELVAGGCSFTGKNDAIKKRGLAISMSKNPKFHKLGNDTWGLAEWYPGAKQGAAQAKADKEAPPEVPTEQSAPTDSKAL